VHTTSGNRWFRLMGIIVLILALSLLAACGSQTTSGSAPTTTVTSGSVGDAATVTPSSTPTTPPAPPSVCTSNGGAVLTEPTEDINDLTPTGARLPDNLPLKPVVWPSLGAQDDVNLKATASLNFTFTSPPAQRIGYVCGVTVRVLTFQPLAGAIPNITLPCVDQYYLDPGGWVPTTACPAGPLSAGTANVVFSSSSPGTIVTAPVTNPWVQQTTRPGQIPSTAGSNYPAWITVFFQVPAAGTYTFSVSFWQSRTGPTIVAPDVTATFARGQYLHEWGGQQCTAPNMQSQLPPPTNPPSHVICPGPPQQH
jgi:hypothetical protein